MSTSNNSTQVFTGEVIQANVKDWSTVIGNGGGYYLMPISISTYHQRVTELWVRLSGGRETRIDFCGDFPALPGHRIAFLATTTHIWAARNFNTGSVCWLATIDWLAGKFRWMAHWIILAGFLPAIVCGFVLEKFRHLGGNAENPGTPPAHALVCLIALVVIAVGFDAMRYCMHRKRIAMWQAVINGGNDKLLNATPSMPPPIPAR